MKLEDVAARFGVTLAEHRRLRAARFNRVLVAVDHLIRMHGIRDDETFKTLFTDHMNLAAQHSEKLTPEATRNRHPGDVFLEIIEAVADIGEGAPSASGEPYDDQVQELAAHLQLNLAIFLTQFPCRHSQGVLEGDPDKPCSLAKSTPGPKRR